MAGRDWMLRIVQEAGTAVGLDARPPETCAPVTAGASQRRTAACVLVAGDWHGAVLVEASARPDASGASPRVAVGNAPAEQGPVDVMGLVASAVGNEVIRQMAGVCHCSLPIIVEGCQFAVSVRGTYEAVSLPFDTTDERVRVSLLCGDGWPPERAAGGMEADS